GDEGLAHALCDIGPSGSGGVDLEGLGDLAPDATQRVERDEGILIDEPDDRTPDAAPQRRIRADVVGLPPADGAIFGGHCRTARGEAEDRAGEQGLAGTGGSDYRKAF